MASFVTLSNMPLKDKRLLIRFDGNVPINKGVISDPYRLTAFIPTLEHCIKVQAQRIVLITHLGRPDPKNPDPTLSTKHLISWFTAQGYPVQFVPQGCTPGETGIYLLENVRFNEGEKSLDLGFAQSLASLADIFINDAWGSMHLKDTSITLLPQQFNVTQRCVGLCVERELKYLAPLKNDPQQPFIVVLGGAKLPEKLPLITGLLEAEPTKRPTALIIGGALSLPLLAAQEKMAKSIISTAQTNNVKLILPSDFIYDNDMGVDIGPETIASFCTALKPAKTIFLNGTMGKYEDSRYAHGTKAVLEAVAKNPGYCVIGGGDAASATHQYNVAQHMSFVSTGGGATLAFLAAKSPESELPGLHALT